MTDGVIKSTGNSRYLKSVANFMALYPTYEDFAAALIRGDLPIDLNGINANGWSQQATPLTKANLLSDATAAIFGYGSTATVNNVLNHIGGYKQHWINRLATLSYAGTGTYGASKPTTITFPFPPEIVIIYPDRIRMGSDYHIGLAWYPSGTSVYWNSSAILLKNQTQLFIYGYLANTGYGVETAKVAFSGNSVKITAAGGPGVQLNAIGYTYYAIGIR